MAEESPLQPSNDTSPLSHKRNIPLTISPQTLKKDLSPMIDHVPNKTQETQLSSEQSSKKPRPNFDDFPLIDSNEKLILGTVGEVSGGDSNEVSGVQLVENHDKLEEFSDGSGLDLCIQKQMLSFDGNGGSSGFVLNKDDLSFKMNDEINECLDLKDEVVQLGSSKNGDLETYSLSMELIDETVVVGIPDNVGKKRGIRGQMGNSNAVCIAGSSNGLTQKMKYSRKELEKLRFVNVESKKKFWQKVYNGFSDDMRKEYDEFGRFRKNKQASGKSNNCYQGILGDSSSENVVHDISNSTHVTYDGEDVVELSEDEKSDDEYHSIQRPAFMVEGEPDFESGPPEDGFEYLRRVRWEAAHIPKVKVVKLDNSKLTEQSAYMPKIPDIEKCPPYLAPSRQWEDEFIADFTELRLALSILGDTSDATSVDSDTIIFSRPESTKHTSKSLTSLELPAGGPTISTLLAMDPVTRVALLNKRISIFESASNLSKDDCSWLFALCAVVETPLDADTSASLRCLLRRCAKLRAEKAGFDDEVVMLNILVTIAGKIFRQSEN